jgi:hypothetical protein
MRIHFANIWMTLYRHIAERALQVPPQWHQMRLTAHHQGSHTQLSSTVTVLVPTRTGPHSACTALRGVGGARPWTFPGRGQGLLDRGVHPFIGQTCSMVEQAHWSNRLNGRTGSMVEQAQWSHRLRK